MVESVKTAECENPRGVPLGPPYVCRLLAIDRSEVFTPGKEPAKVMARSLFCYLAVSELGTSQSELSRHLCLSAASVSMAVKRGRKLSLERGYSFP